MNCHTHGTEYRFNCHQCRGIIAKLPTLEDQIEALTAERDALEVRIKTLTEMAKPSEWAKLESRAAVAETERDALKAWQEQARPFLEDYKKFGFAYKEWEPTLDALLGVEAP